MCRFWLPGMTMKAMENRLSVATQGRSLAAWPMIPDDTRHTAPSHHFRDGRSMVHGCGMRLPLQHYYSRKPFHRFQEGRVLRATATATAAAGCACPALFGTVVDDSTLRHPRVMNCSLCQRVRRNRADHCHCELLVWRQNMSAPARWLPPVAARCRWKPLTTKRVSLFFPG